MNLHRGHNLPPIEEWWFGWDSLQERISDDDWRWLWSDGVEKHGLFRHGHVGKGAIEGIQRLSQVVDVVVITARPKNAVNDTLAWLAYNQFPVSEVHILTAGEPKSSVKVCDFYVDDALHNLEDLVTNTDGKVLLWDRPWNREVSEVWAGWRQRSTRVATWDEVYETVVKP